MKDLGMDAYRFSISWSRIFPSKRFLGLHLLCSLKLENVARLKSYLFGSIPTVLVLLSGCFWQLFFFFWADGTGTPNPEGIQYYSNFIDALIEKGSRIKLIYQCQHFTIFLCVVQNLICFFGSGIQPYATLYHWDLPLKLQETYGGFLSDQIVFVQPLQLNFLCFRCQHMILFISTMQVKKLHFFS